jgi:hypothetical protein
MKFFILISAIILLFISCDSNTEPEPKKTSVWLPLEVFIPYSELTDLRQEQIKEQALIAVKQYSEENNLKLDEDYWITLNIDVSLEAHLKTIAED